MQAKYVLFSRHYSGNALYSPIELSHPDVRMSYRVKDYMDKDFPTIEVEASVVEASKSLNDSKKGYVIVLEKGRPYGIITEWDLVAKILAVEKDPKNVALRLIVSTPLITVDPDQDLIKASELMQQKGIKRLPVVKSSVIYGVLTADIIAQRCGDYVNKSVRDILRWSSPIP